VSLPLMLVGSVPLADSEAVFSTASRYLGQRLARFPDGETGVRRNWIAWQLPVFASLSTLEQTGTKARGYQLHPPFRLRDGYRASDIRFPPLGFARDAKNSYGTFRRLKRDGVIHANARFMVALPTPWAPVYSYIAEADQRAVEAVYERALRAELDEILHVLPHKELSIQWDTATEISWWEKVYPAPFEDIEDGVLAELKRLGEAVPPAVELGYHLCYGSMNNRHWKEPADANVLVAIANGLTRAVARPINFLHMPVPINRHDDAYFAPLAELAIGPQCELYLGLLHLGDGVEGALRRMRAAQKYRTHFGVACECGLGRQTAESIGEWLALHDDVARAADALAPSEK
jgi:hypothetical protein